MSDDTAPSNVIPLHSRLAGGVNVEAARKDGYRCLGPIETAVAIEFAVTGATLSEVARSLGRPLAEVKKAFGNPIARAFIADLQAEIAQHKVVNAAWVEQQILRVWPQLIGEEEVNMINKSGDQVYAKKFHGPEVASILKHFSGNADQKKVGGVNVMINFEAMGVGPPRPVIEVSSE